MFKLIPELCQSSQATLDTSDHFLWFSVFIYHHSWIKKCEKNIPVYVLRKKKQRNTTPQHFALLLNSSLQISKLLEAVMCEEASPISHCVAICQIS